MGEKEKQKSDIIDEISIQKFVLIKKVLSNRSCDVDKVIDDSGGLRIYVTYHDNSEVIIFFTHNHISYMISDEGDRLVIIDEIIKSGHKGTGFFYVNNSEYLKWLTEQKYNAFNYTEEATHYMIVTNNTIVDIISYDEPKVYKDSNGFIIE